MKNVTLEKTIPLVDIGKFVSSGTDEEASEKVAFSLENYGAVIIKDARVSEDDASKFVDMMERYFAQPREKKLQDARPQFFYQVCSSPFREEQLSRRETDQRACISIFVGRLDAPLTSRSVRATTPSLRRT